MHDSVLMVRSYLLTLQQKICSFLEREEGDSIFKEDQWTYQSGKGGGLSRICANGAIIERAGVNFSHVKGETLPKAATEKRPILINAPFQALGVSVVVHPRNPFVPTSHFNVRYIMVEPVNQEPYWWFGGGFDLTPYYGFEEDCVHWHKIAKAACDNYDTKAYSRFKTWADEYFYLKHRQEPRGIGGLFYDDLNTPDFDACFNLMKSVGDHYTKAYQPIIAKRKQLEFTEAQRAFQLYRRGRYVEFNLLYDRGTLFGLQSAGRTESILMSLPPLVAWQYDWHPEVGSEEEKLYRSFLPVREWV